MSLFARLGAKAADSAGFGWAIGWANLRGVFTVMNGSDYRIKRAKQLERIAQRLYDLRDATPSSDRAAWQELDGIATKMSSIAGKLEKAFRIESHNPPPIRIQRKRTKGWKMPDNTVYVGRPTKWGNPYIVGIDVPGKLDATLEFRRWLNGEIGVGGSELRKEVESLRGKNLACFCALDEFCHADVLLEIANEPFAPAEPK